MPTFRYDTTGTWYKGNTHIHSVASDGGKTPMELAQMYAREGYRFLFRTDHWVVSQVEAEPESYPLLWLDGVELDGRDYTGSYYHVVCLGTPPEGIRGFSRERGFVPALEAARADGALLILAHPYWTGNSMEEARRWGFHGVEVYNNVCHWLNGKGAGAVHWDGILEQFPGTLAFAVDDAHLRPDEPGWNGGWIMINAGACTRRAILDAIQRGNFYATQGPEFRQIEYQGDAITVRTSPVRFLRLVGPAHFGNRVGTFGGRLFEEASIAVSPEWPYAYLELEDAQGRRAWTNPLFIKDQG